MFLTYASFKAEMYCNIHHKQMFRLVLVNILLLSMACSVLAQEDDSVSVDSVRISFIPTGIRIGTDLISIGKTQFQSDFSGWEVNADIDFHRYFLALDYGSWSRNFGSKGEKSNYYENDGTYWRVGADVNFLLKDIDRNVFFIGARYGRANFSEDLDIYTSNDYEKDVSRSYSHDDVNARWFELTTGLKVKVWKMIWLGYTARFKFGLKAENTPNIIPADVPGYGRTNKDSYWGFNYQIMVRIPVRKAPPVVVPE